MAVNGIDTPVRNTPSTPTPKGVVDEIRGSIKSVTFRNEETGFFVANLSVPGKQQSVKIVGTAPVILVGQDVIASGGWETRKNENANPSNPFIPYQEVQFRCEKITLITPTSPEGIQSFLASGVIRGVGKVLAKKLWDAFGESIWDVVEEHPERLREVPGLGEKKAAAIAEGWRFDKSVRDIMVFLHSYDISANQANRIYKAFGHNAVAVMKANPYRLAGEVRGFGFQSADAIALKMGWQKDSLERARAGIHYALQQAQSQGHCALPREKLIRDAVQLLGIAESIVRVAVEHEVNDAYLTEDRVAGQSYIYGNVIHKTEKSLAERLSSLKKGVPPWGEFSVNDAISWAEGKTGMSLAESQKNAVSMILKSKLSVLIGGPGTGKTSSLNVVLKILRAKKMSIAVCAPTGKAAKRVTEQTGIEAMTVHRLLGAGSDGFMHNEGNPLECDVLVVDESSMLDVFLANALLKALPSGAAMIIVGDADQLPSVGPGQVLYDIIESGRFGVARLTEIFRQAAASRIITNAHLINTGAMPEPNVSGGDFFFFRKETPQETAAGVMDLLLNKVPNQFGFDPKSEIQILCPMVRSDTGVNAFNQACQDAFAPKGGVSMSYFGSKFYEGDRVLQTENDYDKGVFNGDVGVVTRIDHEDECLYVRFAGKEADIAYQMHELDALRLAYAMTIHRSQGSEFPAVIIPVTTQHYMMLKRNLIYTGITRGRKLVIMVGDESALNMAVRTKQNGDRYGNLCGLLKR